MNDNEKLYIRLLDKCSDIKNLMKNTPQHHSFLNYSKFNMQCTKTMCGCGVLQRQEYFKKIPKLQEECKNCWKFYLNPRNKSIKKYDIIYGRKFEEAFIKFLNSLSIRSCKADTSNKKLPDNLINDKTGNVLAYYEVKYHNAPFVWAYKYVDGRECYEGSITLDYEKVQKQIQEIRTLTSLPVFYLHWVDFPCIKGVFYMTLEHTKEELEKGISYRRKERKGDYKTSKAGRKRKIGYQSKFYPSILKMNRLQDFTKLFI